MANENTGWEYKTMPWSRQSEFEERANALGDSGWEMVQAFERERSYSAVFKRPRSQGPRRYLTEDSPRESKLAACVLVLRQDGKVLAIQQTKKSREGWNLPGGKVEPGESTRTAAARECSEETGVQVGQLSHLYRAECLGPVDGVTYDTTTFVTTDFDDSRLVDDGEEGRVAWVDRAELTKGYFAEYNGSVLKALELFEQRVLLSAQNGPSRDR